MDVTCIFNIIMQRLQPAGSRVYIGGWREPQDEKLRKESQVLKLEMAWGAHTMLRSTSRGTASKAALHSTVGFWSIEPDLQKTNMDSDE